MGNRCTFCWSEDESPRQEGTRKASIPPVHKSIPNLPAAIVTAEVVVDGVTVTEAKEPTVDDLSVEIEPTYRGMYLKGKKTPRRIVLLGLTQVGKSSLFNYMVNGSQTVGDGFKSVTTNCQSQVDNQVLLEVADTPGFSDSNPENDARQYQAIVDEFKKAPVHAIVVVLTFDRLLQSGAKNVLAIAADAMIRNGDDQLRRLAIVINKWDDISEQGERVRYRNMTKNNPSTLKTSQDIVVEQLCTVLREQFEDDSISRMIMDQSFFISVDTLSSEKENTLMRVSYAETFKQFHRFKGWLLSTPTHGCNYRLSDHMIDFVGQNIRRKRMQEEKKQQQNASQEERMKQHLKQVTAEGIQVSKYAELAGFAYLDEWQLRSRLGEKVLGEKVLAYHKHSSKSPGPTYSITVFESTVALAFQGTDSANILDLISNLQNETVPQTIRGSTIKVHSGFLAALTAETGRNNLTWADQIYNELENSLRSSNANRLVYAGHSRGGALAILCRALHGERRQLCGDTWTFTFGAPQVFQSYPVDSPELASLKQVSINSYNYVHGQDIVPRLLLWKTKEKTGGSDIASVRTEDVVAVFVDVALKMLPKGAEVVAKLASDGVTTVGICGASMAFGTAVGTAVTAGLEVGAMAALGLLSGGVALAVGIGAGAIALASWARGYPRQTVEAKIEERLGQTPENFVNCMLTRNQNSNFMVNTDEASLEYHINVSNWPGVPSGSGHVVVGDHYIDKYYAAIRDLELRK